LDNKNLFPFQEVMVCRTIKLVLVLFFLALQVCAVDPNEKVARRLLQSVGRNLEASKSLESTNSTLEISVDRRNLGSTNETFAVDLGEFDGRRNLWSRWDCPNLYTYTHFGHVGVSVKQNKTPTDPICINKRGQKIWQFSRWSGEPEAIDIAVDVKVVDDDRACPGCYEQLHVGLLNQNHKLYYNQRGEPMHKCVNPGHGHFGSKQLTFRFHGVEGGRVYKLVLWGGWDWRCRDDRSSVKHHLSYHARAETIAEIVVW